MIIGLSGYARSGKDTVADILVEEAGFVRVAFADKLREAVYALNPVVVPDDYGPVMMLQDVINHWGWDGYKETTFGPEVRRILQRMGTEVGRNILGENIWVDAVLGTLEDQGRYVFTDCRFKNEASAVTELGGQVWRVDRPGVEPANDHISEIGLDNWPFDVRFNNAGSIQDLADKVWHYAHRL